MRIQLLLVTMFFAIPASAQSGICSGGATDPFYAPIFTSNNVSIYYETQQYVGFSNYPGSSTVAGIAGNNITVTQFGSEIPPPPFFIPPSCGAGIVSLEDLAPGTYNVTWNYNGALISMPFATYHFQLVVPSAQPAPCSAGIQDPPVFSVVASNPVRVTFRDTVNAILSEPSVTIAGNEITVVQTEYETFVAPPASCNSQSVSLGDLPSGSYTLTWKYQSLSRFPLETFSFAFSLPKASPCVLGMSIQPGSPAAGQPVSIIYSVPFRGFLQAPVVAIDGSQITIDQPAVIADPAFPGHVPCARGVVQVGSLRADYYTVAVRSNAFASLTGVFIVRPVGRGRAVRGH